LLPFYVLAGSFLLFWLLGIAGITPLAAWPTDLRWALVAMFALTSSAHWGRGRADLVRMVPSRFPHPGLLVTITGVLEILGALGLLFPGIRHWASACLALLLMAMFPANVHAARQGMLIRGRRATALPLRTVLQLLFIGAILTAGWAR